MRRALGTRNARQPPPWSSAAREAPTRLGVNRVQYEGSLARPGRAADGHEGFVGQVQGNGAQVVFAGLPDD